MLGCAAPVAEEPSEASSEARLLLWQTNAEGDDIHIFDAETGALVRRLQVGPEPHGIAATTDHRTVFVTIEANARTLGELIWIDAVSFEITRRMQIGSLGRLGLSGFERCQGLSIRPDQSEIWSVCGDTLTIHALQAPDFAELASITLPSKGYWLTFSPDARFAYVALADAGEVAMIDAASRAIVTRTRAGEAPKRNLVLWRIGS